MLEKAFGPEYSRHCNRVPPVALTGGPSFSSMR
jgi:hypothetical protein